MFRLFRFFNRNFLFEAIDSCLIDLFVPQTQSIQSHDKKHGNSVEVFEFFSSLLEIKTSVSFMQSHEKHHLIATQKKDLNPTRLSFCSFNELASSLMVVDY